MDDRIFKKSTSNKTRILKILQIRNFFLNPGNFCFSIEKGNECEVPFEPTSVNFLYFDLKLKIIMVYDVRLERYIVWKKIKFCFLSIYITPKDYSESKFSVIPWFRYRLLSSTLYSKAAIKHCNLLFLLYHQYIITTTFCKKQDFVKINN